MRTVLPLVVGWMVAIAGRSTPSNFFKIYIAKPMAAPGIPCGDNATDLSFFCQIEGDFNRGILHPADHSRRRVVHGNHERSMVDENRKLEVGYLASSLLT